MSWIGLALRAVSDRAAPRFVRCCAVLGGPLLMLLLLVTPGLAQVNPASWFEGVGLDDAPQVAHAPPPPSRAPTTTNRVRQPRYYGGGLYLAQSRSGMSPSHQATESLPPPASAATPPSVPPPSSSPSSPLSSSLGGRVEGTLPMAGWDADVAISQGVGGRIDRLVVRDASLSKVLALLAQTYHLNIVASNDIDAVISITLRDVALEEALTAILSVANYTWVDRNGIILITSLSDTAQLSPEVQGRVTEIFELDFASATIVSEAVSNFLSPIGKMTVIESDPTDNRRTRDMIVIEDIPEAIARIGAYLCQVDRPPRQVLIEAHILQVDLKDNEKNGVNFNALARIAGARVNFKTVGFANPAATPAFLTTVDGTDLDAVIELLQTTNDTKTLGSPKVLVLNQQEATVHVGEDLGYQTTVTSELQSTQAPQFLQVGVLLNITPRITRDNRVLLHVRPEVSTGAIDPITQVPNKKTTELETDVMLNDGEGMVIGGLIDEQDITNQSKIPYLGDMWRVGFLFRKSDVTKERKEVIIALVPRILPYSADFQDFEEGEWVRAATPLYKGPLCYVDRPFDAHLPDGKRVAKTYIPPPAHLPEAYRGPCNYCTAPWPQYYVPPKPYPEQHHAEDGYGEPLEGDCVDTGLMQPDIWGQPQPEAAGESLPNGDAGYASPYQEDSIISDQQ